MSAERRPSLTVAIEDSWRHAFRTLAAHAVDGHHAEHGPILAAFAGVPIAFFNQLFLRGPATPVELDAALSDARGRDLPFTLTLAADLIPSSREAVAARGLEGWSATTPGMAFVDLDRAVIGPVGDVPTIRRVRDPAAFEAIAALTAEAFEFPSEVATVLTPPTMADEQAVRWFLGDVDGVPVACGLLVVTGRIAGLYNIAVGSHVRGRGYGSAITRHLLRTARALGCRMAVLQASPMAHDLYLREGFDHVVDFHHFS